MNVGPWRYAGSVLMFAVIILSGYWLSRADKPYSVLVLTVHKLMAVGLFVFLVITLIRANRLDSLSAAELGAGLVAGVFFLTLIVTGGVSAEMKTTMIVARIHQIVPYLTMFATAVTLYLL